MNGVRLGTAQPKSRVILGLACLTLLCQGVANKGRQRVFLPPHDLLDASIKLGLVRVNHYSPPECRFWAQVDRNGPFCESLDSRCWDWRGGIDSDGYGHFIAAGHRRTAAHRYAYALLVGPIPDGLLVIRKCGRLLCCNPAHLTLADRPADDRPSAEQRFWANVDRETGPVHPVLKTRCWPCTLGTDKDGYGSLVIAGHRVKAHRYAYALLVGEIPDGMCCLHACDRPSCCNPAHLTLGTNQDNRDDSVTKGRHAHGERSGQARLTEGDVLEIRATCVPGDPERGYTALGSKYGVGWGAVRSAHLGITWSHVS
jgi:hypothetical protein